LALLQFELQALRQAQCASSSNPVSWACRSYLYKIKLWRCV